MIGYRIGSGPVCATPTAALGTVQDVRDLHLVIERLSGDIYAVPDGRLRGVESSETVAEIPARRFLRLVALWVLRDLKTWSRDPRLSRRHALTPEHQRMRLVTWAHASWRAAARREWEDSGETTGYLDHLHATWDRLDDELRHRIDEELGTTLDVQPIRVVPLIEQRWGMAHA